MTNKELFITAIQLIPIHGNKNIPTVLFYAPDGQIHIGSSAIDKSRDHHLLNEDFKIDLGNIEPSSNKTSSQCFKTARGERKSAAGLTLDFINKILKEVYSWLDFRDLQKAARLLLAEPLSMREGVASDNWLANYRENLRRILYGKFDNIEFLPEPFAVFQYYRYGVRHPLVSERIKHVAFVVDFGGGTFDTCIVETTIQGDVSMSGKHSRPLAASSRPIGGYYINRVIAEELFFKYVIKQEHKSKARKSIDLYKKWREGYVELEHLNDEHRSFVTHFHELIYRVEKSKLLLCRSITNWDLNARLDISVPIALPHNPFSRECRYDDFSLTAGHLREIFTKTVWVTQLKGIIAKALERGKQELNGARISVVLLSGGSSNIRWLSKLIEQDFKEYLGEAAIIDLGEDFQEVVAKGLAIECARRTYTTNSEFISVTYNPICLILKPNELPCEVKRFKSLTPGIETQEKEGIILPSASSLRNYFDIPIRWKVKLDNPPTQKLKYYFLRSTYDPEDRENLLNIVNNVVYTPKDCKFDSSIQVEIAVREDGTCTPKFIYKIGRQNEDINYILGDPFYIDMTYSQLTTHATAYLGLDFGTSNSSISYVDQLSIKTYQQRSLNEMWRTLNDLVHSLPYPLSDTLARYIGGTPQDNFVQLALDFIEAALSMAAYISFLEFCTTARHPETSTKLFHGFTQRSAGPLWKLLQESLKQIGKKAIISTPFLELLRKDNYDIIDNAINMLANHKHSKISDREIDHNKPVHILANISHNVFCKNMFGFFDYMQPQKFGRGIVSTFRHATAMPPFSTTSQYKGEKVFSKEQAVLVNIESKTALQLHPLMFWDHCNKHPDIDDGHCYLFDKPGKEDGRFSFKAVGYDCCKMVSKDDGENSPLAEELTEFRHKDPLIKFIEGIELKRTQEN